jgi:hypothetical protein
MKKIDSFLRSNTWEWLSILICGLALFGGCVYGLLQEL